VTVSSPLSTNRPGGAASRRSIETTYPPTAAATVDASPDGGQVPFVSSFPKAPVNFVSHLVTSPAPPRTVFANALDRHAASLPVSFSLSA
jgi:hypothetical protein